MNCKKFDFNLYFEMENLVAQLIEQQVFSPKEIYTKFKDVLKNDYNLKNVTNDDLKSYFVSSSFDSDVITSLMSYSDVKNTNTLEKGLDFIESDKMFNHIPGNVNKEIEQKEKSSNDVVITNILEKPIKRIKKIESVNDLYNNYFSGSMLHYNRFRKDFARNIFSASLISFDAKNSYIVKSDEDVDNNIKSYRNKLETIISEFLLSKNIEPEEKTKDKLTQIENLKLSNLDAFASSNTDDATLNEVYNAFIALTHFDELIKLYSTLVSKDSKSGQYRLEVEHKMKNNFSDNPIDIIAEISQLTKSLIEFTPILDNNGKEIKGKYLKINQLTSIISKFKDSNILNNLTMSLRENVEENISLMMRKYLENPHDFKNNGFDNSDTEIIRSVYNYFYKTGEESPNVLKQMNPSTVSMLTIKNNEYANKNYSDYNILADTITTTIDKTIGQKYITLKDTQEGMIRQITKDITVSKYVSQLKNDLNAKSNIAISLPEGVDNALMVNDDNNISLYKTDKIINFTIPGLPIDIKINPFNKFAKGFLKCPINNLLNQEDISNFINNGTYPTNEGKKNYIALLEVIGKYTGINFFQNNGDLLNSISSKGIRFVEEGLYTASRVLFFRSVINEYNAEKINSSDLKLSDFLNSNHIGLTDKEIYGNRLTPFNEISTVEFFKEVGYAMATIKGDVAASISRNLNGDGLPNNSLLNLIGDYKTIFNQHKSANPEDSVTSNFFVYNDNYEIIKDVIFRSDVQMKDGTIKNVKSFNASEIMYQALFSDFWSNAYDPKGTNGLVMMEPTVFADKSGQPMKVIDMDAKIKYNYTNEITGKVEFDVNDKSLFDLSNMPSYMGLSSMLSDLYFYTMKGQYVKLHKKLMNDYKFLTANMLLDTTTMLTLGKDVKNKPIYQSVAEYVKTVIKDVNNITLYQMNNILGKGVKLENYRKSATGESIDIQLEFHYTKQGVNGYLLKKFKEYQIVEYDKTYHQRRMQQEDKKFAVSYSKILGNTVVLKDNGDYKFDFENVVKSYLVNSQKVTDDKLDDALNNGPVFR